MKDGEICRMIQETSGIAWLQRTSQCHPLPTFLVALEKKSLQTPRPPKHHQNQNSRAPKGNDISFPTIYFLLLLLLVSGRITLHCLQVPRNLLVARHGISCSHMSYAVNTDVFMKHGYLCLPTKRDDEAVSPQRKQQPKKTHHSIHPPKTNMEPKNGGLDFKGIIFMFHVSFRGSTHFPIIMVFS